MNNFDISAILYDAGLPLSLADDVGVDIKDLQAIHDDHLRSFSALQSLAIGYQRQLEQFTGAHTVKWRIKSPAHLVTKILRKRRDNPDRPIVLINYKEEITDLVGLRVLHLLKDDWEVIHKGITDHWDLIEQPTANVRVGDSENDRRRYVTRGVQIREHPAGYRSVHYLVSGRAMKIDVAVEIQVRTLIEETWSEIDHRVRYPNHANDHLLSAFLLVFNRTAGTADEMGTFVYTLKREVDALRIALAHEKEKESKQSELLARLNALPISDNDRSSLRDSIANLASAELLLRLENILGLAESGGND